MFPKLTDSTHITALVSAAFQAQRDNWVFDPISFAIGFLVALLLVSLLFRYRSRIAEFWDGIKQKAKQLQQRLTASMADRYSVNTIETAQTRHLFGALTSFDEVYVDTRLYAALAPSQNASGSPSFTPAQAVEAGDRLVIIGHAGSGRTMLLNRILLLQARKVRLAGEHERVPVYIYLPVLASELRDSTEADTPDNTAVAPAHVLVKTALSSMSRVVATGVARWLRRQIEVGNAVVLLDGWDEVEATDRPVVTDWIQELITAYPGNRLVGSAGERGYSPLVKIGFVPLRPVPWKNRQFKELAQRWSKTWANTEGDKDVSTLSIAYTLTVPTPLEATTELVIKLCGLMPASTPAGKMRHVLNLLFPPPEVDADGTEAWPPDTGDRALGKLALNAIERGRLTLKREEIQSAVSEAMPPPLYSAEEEEEGEAAGKKPKTASEEEERRTLQIVDCCRALTTAGAPIRSWDNQYYYFAHPLIVAFLAARFVAAEGIPIEAHTEDGVWLDVLPFYVGLAPAEPLVKRLMSGPDDIFLSHLWRAASLLAASPLSNDPWRAGLMARLGQLFLNPRMPAYLRESCLIALIDSHETGVSVLFRQAATGSDASVRAGAILGLGALGQDQDLLLIDAALSDPEFQVRMAAINALDIFARLGNAQAMELIIAAMIEAEDQVQRVAVEALAELGPEGHSVLRDAAQDEDLIVRRAAIYGLAAVGEPWATEIIEQLQREDDEWLVRNAAVQALESLHLGDDKEKPQLEMALPQAESEPWLIAWAAERGAGTGTGDAALTTLVRALNEGDITTRLLALDTLRRLGDPRTIDVLRQTLRDPEPSVRLEALVALDEISRCHDLTITLG
jgi:HEAT repeat protein